MIVIIIDLKYYYKIYERILKYGCKKKSRHKKIDRHKKEKYKKDIRKKAEQALVQRGRSFAYIRRGFVRRICLCKHRRRCGGIFPRHFIRSVCKDSLFYTADARRSRHLCNKNAKLRQTGIEICSFVLFHSLGRSADTYSVRQNDSHIRALRIRSGRCRRRSVRRSAICRIYKHCRQYGVCDNIYFCRNNSYERYIENIYYIRNILLCIGNIRTEKGI